MRLKGYLRGFGAGMFISAVLMGIAASGKDTLSDEEIRSRAAALGMVEEDSVLIKPKAEEPAGISINKAGDDGLGDKAAVPSVDIKPKKDEETEKDNPDKETENNEEDLRAKEDRAMGGQNDAAALKDTAAEEKPTEAPKEKSEEKPEEKSEEKPVTKDVKQEGSEAEGSFTLQIASGTTSYSVAKLLQKGGVIDNADDFDNYLCENHYDNRINHGVFKIPTGADYEEIALIITGKK